MLVQWPGRRLHVGDGAGLASRVNRGDAVDGMEQRCSQRRTWWRHAGLRWSLNWVGGRWFEKIGSASAWARFLIIFTRRRHRQAWLGGGEWESPKAGTVSFPPPLEDGVTIGIDDGYLRLGEGDPAAHIGKWPQAYEGMGEGGHHMTPHRCRRKRWDRCEGCAGN